MKIQNKFISGILVTVAVGASVAGARVVTQTNPTGDGSKGTALMGWDQRIDEIKLIDEGNYDSWKQYMIGSGRQMIADKVTVDEFTKMAALFDAIKAGQYDQAKVIAKDLKLPNGLGMGRGGRRGLMRADLLKLPEVMKLSAEVQAKLKAAHLAKDRELVRQILEENNITPPAKGKFKDRKTDQDDATTTDQTTVTEK